MKGKERSYLKGLANPLKAKIQVGKAGLSPEFFDQLEILLDHEELVKINVLKNAPVEAREIKEEILETTGAEFVSQLGKKLVIYRPSKDDPKIELPQ